MPARLKAPRKPKPQDILRARGTVLRWIGWFVPMIALLGAILWMQLDYRFVAVCLLGFPMITIRLVGAWGEYQQLRDAAARPDSGPAGPAVSV